MKKNLFDVGEVVVLQSKESPELNGEYTVKSVLFHNDTYICRLTEKILIHIEEMGYILEELVIETLNGAGNMVEQAWSESALRKKHQGCGDSFQSMLSKLNTKIVEEL